MLVTVEADAIGKACSCGFIDDPEYIKACQSARIPGSLPLCVIKISWDCNYRLFHRAIQEFFSFSFQGFKYLGRQFDRSKKTVAFLRDNDERNNEEYIIKNLFDNTKDSKSPTYFKTPNIIIPATASGYFTPKTKGFHNSRTKVSYSNLEAEFTINDGHLKDLRKMLELIAIQSSSVKVPSEAELEKQMHDLITYAKPYKKWLSEPDTKTKIISHSEYLIKLEAEKKAKEANELAEKEAKPLLLNSN